MVAFAWKHFHDNLMLRKYFIKLFELIFCLFCVVLHVFWSELGSTLASPQNWLFSREVPYCFATTSWCLWGVEVVGFPSVLFFLETSQSVSNPDQEIGQPSTSNPLDVPQLNELPAKADHEGSWPGNRWINIACSAPGNRFYMYKHLWHTG